MQSVRDNNQGKVENYLGELIETCEICAYRKDAICKAPLSAVGSRRGSVVKRINKFGSSVVEGQPHFVYIFDIGCRYFKGESADGSA
jgi:hypothetical protein